MPHALPAVGAVDAGGLVQAGVDGGQGGEVDDHGESGVLPDVAQDVDGPEPALLVHEVDRGPARQADEVVDQEGYSEGVWSHFQETIL